LVPEIPKEETPARRGRPSPPQGRGSVSSSTSPALQSTAVVGVPTCRAVAHRHDHLDDGAYSGGRLGVAHVGLDGAQPQRPALGSVLPVGGDDGLCLDGVAERGAGAVGLDRVDVVRGQLGVGERLLDDPDLGRTAGRGQAVGGTVLVDGAAADDGEHLVPVAAGVGQPLDEEHARSLRPCGAGGVVGEGVAAAVGRQGTALAELDEHLGAGHDRGPARQREGALTLAQ